MSPTRLATTLWIILLAAVMGRILLAKPGSHSVVPIYQNAAARWLAGEDIYAPATGLDVYLYSPTFAVSFVMLDPLPRKAGEILWRGLSVTVLLVSLRNVCRVTKLSPAQSGWLFSGVAVLATPCVNNGQPNLLLAGLIAGGYAALKENRLTRASVLLGAAAGIKFYPIAVFLLSLMVKPRMVKPSTATLLTLFAIPFLFQSPDYVLREYERIWQALQAEDRTGNFALFRVPHDWTILPRLWLDVSINMLTLKIVSGVAGLMMAWFVFRRSCLDSVWILGSLWMTLFGPSTEIPTYMLLAPAAMWRHVKSPSVLTLLSIALLTVPIVRGMFPMDEATSFRSAAPLGALLLLINAICHQKRESTITMIQARLTTEVVKSRKVRRATRRSIAA